MPSGFRRIAGDLTQGRDLGLYIVVAIAIAVALLGGFNVIAPAVLGAATLAVLAVLATISLSGRHRLDDLQAVLDRLAVAAAERPPADRYLDSRRPVIEEAVETAGEVGLAGVSLTRTVNDLLPALERRLRTGLRLRVLLIDVDSPAYAEAMARSAWADSADFYRNRVASTTDLLRRLASTAHDSSSVELRMLPFVPAFGLRLIDADRVWVRIYQHRSLEADPTLSLTSERDAKWYAMFAGQFETLWASVRPYPLA
jgi:hypothetical protein